MDFSLRNLFEKYALDQGFSISLGESDGWLVFQAHAVPTKLALSESTQGTLLVGTSNFGVGSELAHELEPAPFAHKGFHCFIAPDSTDLFRIIGRIWALARALPNEPLAEFERLVSEPISTTEVERSRKERIGQDVFRRTLLSYWGEACAVTDVQHPALLRASHIIPWAECETDEERLNVYNGLLLAANLDAAFDAGLISFADSGAIIVAHQFEPDCQAAGIDLSMRLKRISKEHHPRLKYHRTNIFKESVYES